MIRTRRGFFLSVESSVVKVHLEKMDENCREKCGN